MTGRVLLHIGTPKTGTSQLQDVLFKNRVGLLVHGINYPADRFDAHFLGALDLMRLPWGGLETQAVGAWDALATSARRWPGTTIISHEILAAASRTQAAKALDSFGDAQVHLVLSVRDLVRQIPAEWQENIKHRSSISYRRFLRTIQDPERSTRISSWFWSVQEIPDIIKRWGSELPPERIHLVTVPPPGALPDQLWDRFAEVFGLTGLDLTRETERANPSLGVPETALLRRINKVANPLVAPPDYRPLVRELLAHQTLSQRTGSPRLALSPQVHSWVQDLSASWVEEIRRQGYHVVGDVEDLLGAPVVTEFADPDRPRQREVVTAAVEAITALLQDDIEVRREADRLRQELEETRIALERAHLRPSYRLREKIVRRLESSDKGQGLMHLYRRARGRAD